MRTLFAATTGAVSPFLKIRLAGNASQSKGRAEPVPENQNNFQLQRLEPRQEPGKLKHEPSGAWRDFSPDGPFSPGKDLHIMGIMKRFGQTGSAAYDAAPETFQPASIPQPSEPAPQIRVVPQPVHEASIGNGLVFKGTITGGGSLFIDGEVVGHIDLPDSRVTVGPTGHVSDGLSICINAREIVVMGKIRGNICAADLVEIRAEGSLTGNVSARRISIADGAFFKGDIDLRSTQPNPSLSAVSETSREVYA